MNIMQRQAATEALYHLEVQKHNSDLICSLPIVMGKLLLTVGIFS
jgi:hypothetical protein